MPAGWRGGNRRCLPIVMRCVSAGSHTLTTSSWTVSPSTLWTVDAPRASVMSSENLLYLHAALIRR